MSVSSMGTKSDNWDMSELVMLCVFKQTVGKLF